MYKYKKWLILPGILAVLFVGMTWLTGYRLDQQLTAMLAGFSQTPGVVTSWFDQEKSLFRRKASLHLLIAEPEQLLRLYPTLQGDNQLQRLLQQVGSLDLYIEITHSILPGMVWGQAHLDLQQGMFAALPEKPVIPHELYWKMNAFTGNLLAGLHAQQWNWLHGEQTWLVAPLQFDASISADKQLDLAVTWQGMQWRDESRNEQGKLTNFSFNGCWTVNDGLWLMPKAQLALQQLELHRPERQLQIKQWEWQTAIRENKDGLLSVVDVNSHSNIHSLSYSSQQRDYQLSDVHAGLALGGVNRQGVESLLMNSGLDAGNSSKWQTGLNLITRTGVYFHLEPFDLQLNRQPMSVHGQMTTRPFDMSQVHGVESMRSLLQGDVSVDMAPALASELTPGTSQLSDLLADGYLEQTTLGHVSTRLRMVNGKLSANGIALPY